MRRALEEARRGLGRTSPNPPVGAVVVRDGQVIATGHHPVAGGPHAEVVALDAAGERARGADLYVTLEPCDHWGRTGPCAPRVVEAGIARCFVGTPDPNPLVSGRGLRRMEQGGVQVRAGVLREETDALIEPWAHFIGSGRPFVTLKVASTLDGRIATSTGESRWITGPGARRLVHELRDEVDAVIVGAGTVRADDPALNTRIEGGRDPLRVILASRLEVDPAARIFHLESTARTLIACVEAAPDARAALEAVGAEVLVCRAGQDGRVDLDDLLIRLAARGVVHVLVEGGARVFGAFLEAGRCDRLLLHQGPKIFGAGPAWTDAPRPERVADAPMFRYASARLVEGDLVIEARPAAQETAQPHAESRGTCSQD